MVVLKRREITKDGRDEVDGKSVEYLTKEECRWYWTERGCRVV